MNIKNIKILPTITSAAPDWREKIREIKKLGLKEIAFFPTRLRPKERQEFYQLLKETKVNSVPFVHLRSDMHLEELDYLVEKYKTKIFNTHTKREFPINPGYKKYKNIIYIENTNDPYNEEEIREFAGICIDFAHLEHDRTSQPQKYQKNIEIIEKYKCGCNHIAPVATAKNYQRHHLLESFSQLDYIKNYPAKYFSSFLALELENSIKKQLKAREYIINLLK